ncbi:MAG: DUF3035 domain-containing protein [Rhodobacterales bacterium]|nr:DUF3035 domain-containing protein [Rhodobacterales bacterium]
MQGNRMLRATILMAVMTLAACGGYERDITLRSFKSNSGGPDEFTIIPGKTLEAPDDFASLPVPTPGGTNLTDQTPNADAIVALGGRASALELRGVPASDGAIVNHASRYGVPADIRTSLATEDEEFRRRKSRFTKFRIARVDRYNQVYKRQSLDPFRETRRFRRMGVRTPTSPPSN